MADDRFVRELCARVVKAEGIEFETALLELADALELLPIKEAKPRAKAAAGSN